MPRIIISYRRADTLDIAMRIRDQLALRYGKESVFTDIDSIPIGSDFLEHISNEIATSDVLLAIVGQNWLARGREHKSGIESETDYVRLEVESALKQDIPVVPVVVSGAQMPQPSELPETIRNFAHRNAATVDSGLNFQTDVDRLSRSLDRLIAQRRRLPETSQGGASEPPRVTVQPALDSTTATNKPYLGNPPKYAAVGNVIAGVLAARRTVPAVDFSIGAGCIATLGALILGFLGYARTSFVIFGAMVVAMALTIMASRTLVGRSPTLALAGRVILWAVAVLFLGFLVVAASAWTFKAPPFMVSLLGIDEESAVCSSDAVIKEAFSCGFGDYVVQNIRLNDDDHGLWIRDMADMSGLKEMLLPPNAAGVSVAPCDASAQWCKVQCNGKSGWSKRIYLGPRSQATRVVTGLNPNDARGLDVRIAPDPTCRPVGTVLNRREVILHGCQPNHADGHGPTWCLITDNNVSGWIPDGYLGSPPPP